MSDTTYVQLLQLAIGLVLVCSFMALWRRELVAVARVLAAQGLGLGIVALLIGLHEHHTELIVVSVLVALLRAVVLPGVLIRIVRAGDERREVESLVNVPASLLAAAGLTLVAYGTTRDVVALAPSPEVEAIPIGVAVGLIGIFMLVARRKAVSQIMGVLMLDNGIALVALLGTAGVPLVVELGIAADVLVAILILQLLTSRMRTKFGATDLNQLRELHD
ncbi:MAG: hypothetical protein AB7Q42_20520 [Acidimicrobiia bacterium]